MRQERRAGSRHPIRVDVVLDDSTRYRCGATLDLSLAGALISSSEPMPVGAAVRLIPLVDASLPVLELQGRVVRSASARAGGHTVAVALDLSLSEERALDQLFEGASWSIRAPA